VSFSKEEEEEDGWRDFFNGGEVGVLPSESAVVQARQGGGHGAAAHGPFPAPRERRGSPLPQPPRHGDRRCLRSASQRQVHRPLLPRQCRRYWSDVRALRRVEHPPPRQSPRVFTSRFLVLSLFLSLGFGILDSVLVVDVDGLVVHWSNMMC